MRLEKPIARTSVASPSQRFHSKEGVRAVVLLRLISSSNGNNNHHHHHHHNHRPEDNKGDDDNKSSINSRVTDAGFPFVSLEPKLKGESVEAQGDGAEAARKPER